MGELQSQVLILCGVVTTSNPSVVWPIVNIKMLVIADLTALQNVKGCLDMESAMLVRRLQSHMFVLFGFCLHFATV